MGPVNIWRNNQVTSRQSSFRQKLALLVYIKHSNTRYILLRDFFGCHTGGESERHVVFLLHHRQQKAGRTLGTMTAMRDSQMLVPD